MGLFSNSDFCGPNDSDLSVVAFKDFFSFTAGVVEFSAAETFDYQITGEGQAIGNRILDNNGGGEAIGPAESVSDNFIDELFGSDQ